MSRSRKSRSRSGFGGVIATILVIAILVGAGVVLGPRLIHRCDKCDEVIVGTGYYANVVTDLISDLSGKEAKILCRECAMSEHALAIAAGASLKDYQRPLFETAEAEEAK